MFEQLVDQAMRSQQQLAPLRVVVEKELLHHDILREMGSSGLILQVQSREEILADKFVALALRPIRIKNRDLWDIIWLNQQGINLPVPLVLQKVTDRRQDHANFLAQLQQRTMLLQSNPAARKDF